MIWLKEISVKKKQREREREIPTAAGKRGDWGRGGAAFPNLQTFTAALCLQSPCSGLEMEAALGGAS